LSDLILGLGVVPIINENDTVADPSARKLDCTRVDDPLLDQVAGGSVTGLGTGGMVTKVRAARLAARSGTPTVIAPGRGERVLTRIGEGESVAGQLQVRGRLTLDQGAVRALREKGTSLLAVGVKSVQGTFQRGEVVACLDEEGREVARGLVNYDVQEALRIRGEPSGRFESILGYLDDPELIHRDNLVLL
jgi:glutamate 5-kinase